MNAKTTLLTAGTAFALAFGGACAHFAPQTHDDVDIAPGDLHAKDLTKLVNVRSVAGDPIVVVKDGVARLPIVYVRGGNNDWAARYLADTLFEMTGVKPALVPETPDKPATNAPAFYVGATAAAAKAGLRAPEDHPEAFRVVARDGSVYFLGRGDFGVYDWCERQLDVRYFWPQKPADMHGTKGTNFIYGKCTVKTQGLAVRPVDYDDRPVFAYRDNWPYDGTPWNRTAKGGNSHRGGVNVHAPHGWWKEADTVKDHIGIFALSADGKRPTSPLLCYGNPETLAYYKQRVLDEIAGTKKPSGIVNLRTKVITISQWDCGVHCACEHCKKLFDAKLGSSGSGSPIIWGYFTKEFAKWARQTLPDYKISILPYINTCDVPPGLDLTAEGNVEAMLCTMPGLALLKNEQTKKHEEDLIRQWAKCTGNPVLNWHYSCWPAEFTSAPFVYGETIQKHYQDMRKTLCGTFINGGYDAARLSLSAYVWMRCLWNPDVDVHAIYDSFAARMFGPAAKPMRKLIDMQEKGWNRQWKSNQCSVRNVFEISYPRAEVLAMEDLFAQAYTLAAGDEKVKARLDWYHQGFEQFLKESGENASGTAFVPLLMKKAVTPPMIDGKLDDACWKDAEARELVAARCRTNSVPKYKTEVRVVWYPGTGVTFGFHCEEPATDAMKQGVAGDTWGQDNLEVFIDASGVNEGHYYQVIADATGRISTYTDGPEWKPQGLQAKVDIADGYWTMELFFPFSDLAAFENAQVPTTSAGGCQWNGNFNRWRVGDMKLPKEQRQPGSVNDWARLYTRYNHWNRDPAAFGKFIFVE